MAAIIRPRHVLAIAFREAVMELANQRRIDAMALQEELILAAQSKAATGMPDHTVDFAHSVLELFEDGLKPIKINPRNPGPILGEGGDGERPDVGRGAPPVPIRRGERSVFDRPRRPGGTAHGANPRLAVD